MTPPGRILLHTFSQPPDVLGLPATLCNPSVLFTLAIKDPTAQVVRHVPLVFRPMEAIFGSHGTLKFPQTSILYQVKEDRADGTGDAAE
jgi:hypothetical protein